MAENRFKPWMGHVPRDRASVWYVTPVLINILGLIVLGLAATAIVVSVVAG